MGWGSALVLQRMMLWFSTNASPIALSMLRVQPHIHFVVLQVYAPHSGRPEEESDAFYAQLNDVIAGLTRHSWLALPQ
jgi:hypothetical protein